MVEIVIPETTAAVPDGREVTLPSGKKASFRRGTGKDVRLALAAVGQPFDSTRYLYALIARTAKIDGRPTTMEAIDEIDAEDAETLLEEVRKPSPSPKAPAP